MITNDKVNCMSCIETHCSNFNLTAAISRVVVSSPMECGINLRRKKEIAISPVEETSIVVADELTTEKPGEKDTVKNTSK